MRDTTVCTPIVVTLLVVLATIGIGAVALTGTAAAQSGTVQITSEITSDDESFEVEVTGLQETQLGCLEVTNLNTGALFQRTDVTAGDQFTVLADEIGGLEAGDIVEATLYEEQSECSTELSSDTRTVQGITEFEVTLDATHSPVVEGEKLTVNATIENTGEVAGTQSIDLLIGDSFEDSRNLTVDSNESIQIALEWQTESGDAGTYQASVNSEDDFESADVRVEEPAPANFQVAIDSTNAPVAEEQEVNATARIENTGDNSDTQTIEFRIDNTIQDARSVTLDGGETQHVPFNWQTELGDAGTYNATVLSDDDSASTDVLVGDRAPPNFAVTINTTNGPVLEGEGFRATATVHNTGRLADTQSIELQIDDTVVDSRSVTLTEGESETVTLEWNTTVGDAGLNGAVVASNNDTAFANATVLAEGTLHLSIEQTNTPVVEGEELQVTATVLNTGDTETSQAVNLRIDNQTVDAANLTLPGGESESLTLSWQTEAGDRGDYDAEMATEDGSDTAAVSVVTDAWFDVSITSTNDPISVGEELFITATISNTGDVTGTQTVTLTDGQSQQDSRDLTLEPNESQEITLSWITEDADPDEYEIEVASQDNNDLAVVTVTEAGGGDLPLWLLILLLLIFLLLIAVAYYLYQQSQEEGNRQTSLAPGSQ